MIIDGKCQYCRVEIPSDRTLTQIEVCFLWDCPRMDPDEIRRHVEEELSVMMSRLERMHPGNFLHQSSLKTKDLG